MTRSADRHIHSHHGPLADFKGDDPRLTDWPVVYVLNNARDVYVGESLNVVGRLAQHQKSPDKKHLDTAHVLVDSSFNKSAALDLESHLVRYLAGDGRFNVLNRNEGIVDADYVDRDKYREQFKGIYAELLKLGVFTAIFLRLPVAFGAIVRHTKHLAVVKACKTTLRPCGDVIGVHFFNSVNALAIGVFSVRTEWAI